MPEQWIADNVVADINNGVVTIRIELPRTTMPGKKAEDVAEEIWYQERLDAISLAQKKNETKSVCLTRKGSRTLKRSRLRLGGGFVQIQGDNIVIPRRDSKAPRRPCAFTECSGIFEDTNNDYIKTMLLESVEVVRFKDGVLYIPELPGELGKQYNDDIADETVKAVKAVNDDLGHVAIPLTTKKVCVEIVKPKTYTLLQFDNKDKIPIVHTAEVDTSSLECVGFLHYIDLPQDVCFQDTECSSKDEYLRRETHVINYKTGDDTVWKEGSSRSSTLEKEFEQIEKEWVNEPVEESDRLYATEKLRAAIEEWPSSLGEANGLQLFLNPPSAYGELN